MPSGQQAGPAPSLAQGRAAQGSWGDEGHVLGMAGCETRCCQAVWVRPLCRAGLLCGSESAPRGQASLGTGTLGQAGPQQVVVSVCPADSKVTGLCVVCSRAPGVVSVILGGVSTETGALRLCLGLTIHGRALPRVVDRVWSPGDDGQRLGGQRP